MKTFFLMLSLVVFLSLSSRAQQITGTWEGTLSAGVQRLKIVFHVQLDSGKPFKSSFDSPDQGAFGIPCSSTRLETGDSLEMEIRVIHAGYRGKWDGNNGISGYYFQNGQHFPTSLSRIGDSASMLIRPQTPRPPFPYHSENLEYNNPDSRIHYSGTLTYPESGGPPYPAAILISGSGQQDRDGTVFGHKPLAVIADYLTRRGYAVLRVDDRQTGNSTGDLSQATSRDFANDVEVGLKQLRQRKNIDQKKIGLIGHSEGGFIATMAAAENKSIHFVILLAGPGLKGSELLKLQNEAVARSLGASREAAEAAGKLNALLVGAALHSRDTSLQMQEARDSLSSWKKNTDPAIVKSMGLYDEKNTENFLRSRMEIINKPWMIYFLQTDPAAWLSRLHCPVLALNGSKDIQVVPDQNLAAIDRALKKSQVKNYQTKEIPGLNRLFQHCKTCTVAEYSQLRETFAPEALQIMGDWLDKTIKHQ